LRRGGTATAQAQRRVIAHGSGFFIQQPHFPLPEIDSAAGVQEGFGGPQLELTEGSGTCGPAEAVELLAVNAEEKPDVIPAEDSAEDGIKFVKKERVGHGDNADDHGTHVAENGSKNQSLEGG
jgi:hypothetical protein